MALALLARVNSLPEQLGKCIFFIGRSTGTRWIEALLWTDTNETHIFPIGRNI